MMMLMIVVVIVNVMYVDVDVVVPFEQLNYVIHDLLKTPKKNRELKRERQRLLREYFVKRGGVIITQRSIKQI